jgi:hypothetical protein
MRKLASIQRVVNVEPIVGADKIECITVLGWKLVSKIGEFKIGDLCVYTDTTQETINRFLTTCKRRKDGIT